MVRLLVLAGICAGTHAFTAAPVGWKGMPAKRFVVAPVSEIFVSRGEVPPQNLAIWDPRDNPITLPCLAYKSDGSIACDAMAWCIEAAGTKSGDTVRVNRCTGEPRQRWDWLPQGAIQLRGTRQCLDVLNRGHSLSGSLIELQECENKVTQSWGFEDPIALPIRDLLQHPSLLFLMPHAMTIFVGLVVFVGLGLGSWLRRWRQQESNSGSVRSGDMSGSLERAGGLCLAERLTAHQDDVPAAVGFDACGQTGIVVPACMVLGPQPVENDEPREGHETHAKAEENVVDVVPTPDDVPQQHLNRRAVTSMMVEGSESLTERLMRTLPDEGQSTGAGGKTTYEGLLGLDASWRSLCNKEIRPARRVVTEDPNGPLESPDFDVVVCGGTLGILLAAALQLRGFNVAVVEAGKLRGRNQDWNVSRKEVMDLVEIGVLTLDDVATVIGIEFNPVRVGFLGGEDIWIQDVLNVGVRPNFLITAARRTFEANGGRVFEESPLDTVVVRPGAAVLSFANQQEPIRARLVIDSMGQRSPIVAQVRDGQLPDGVAIVVGSCASGFPQELNTFGDVIFQDSPTMPSGSSQCPTQYFWEAFPASSGPQDRTTYLFTYMDLAPERPSVLDIMEDYWKLFPKYQGVALDEVELKRVLYGLFVSYKDSPLPASFDRVLQAGDASGIQSPLSFGGFGALTRHIGRMTIAISSALEADALSKNALGLINPYLPNQKAAWLFQETMRPPIQKSWLADLVTDDMFISSVLNKTFETQQAAGFDTMKPFLQDVLRVDGLARTIGGLAIRHPASVLQILPSLGLEPLADWTLQFLVMCIYTALSAGYDGSVKEIVSKLPPRLAYEVERRAEAWQYGAGLDYVFDEDPPLSPELLAKGKAGAAAARARARKLTPV